MACCPRGVTLLDARLRRRRPARLAQTELTFGVNQGHVTTSRVSGLLGSTPPSIKQFRGIETHQERIANIFAPPYRFRQTEPTEQFNWS